MNWQDRLDSIVFTIITGDNKSFTPVMAETSNDLPFNTKDLMYLNRAGGFVNAGEAGIEQYEFTFWFIGDNHVEDMLEFKKSSKNKNPWKITHPFFGELQVQVESLRIASSYGQTYFVARTKETIDEELPEINVNLESDIKNNNIEIENSLTQNIEVNSLSAGLSSISTLSTNYNSLPNSNSSINELKNKVIEVTGALQNVISKPVEFNESLKALIRFPIEQAASLKSAIVSCKNAILEMASLITSDPNLYDINSSILITTVTESAISADYKTWSEVNEVIRLILEMYNSQILTFESANYIQNNEVSFALSVSISKTLGRLNQIAFNAKQERFIVAGKTANPILYAVEFYGNKNIDDSLKRLIDENKLSVDEMIQIKYGRELVYYV